MKRKKFRLSIFIRLKKAKGITKEEEQEVLLFVICNLWPRRVLSFNKFKYLYTIEKSKRQNERRRTRSASIKL